MDVHVLSYKKSFPHIIALVLGIFLKDTEGKTKHLPTFIDLNPGVLELRRARRVFWASVSCVSTSPRIKPILHTQLDEVKYYPINM